MSSLDKKKKEQKLKPWLPKRWDCEADVVVVGYGGAGACAAIAAHDAGAKALILEKAPFGGGNTRVSAGSSQIPSNVSDAIEYYRALAWGAADEELVLALAEAMVGLPHRLEGWGAELKYSQSEPQYPTLPGSRGFRQRIRFVCTPRQREEGLLETSGEPLFDFLKSQVSKREIRVMYGTPAKELIQDLITKEILGVKAESSGKEISVKARRGVVLACGGFAGNREMLVNFLPYLEVLPFYPFGTPYNTGDGILMASKVGAKLWHMPGVEYGTFAPKAPSEEFGVAFRLWRQMQMGACPAIYVNKYGKRFMSESRLLSHLKELFEVQYFDAEHVEYPNIPFYLVFDESYRRKGPIVEARYGWWCVNRLYEWSADNSAEIERGWIMKADTIRELAGKTAIDPDVLEETVGKYNEYCATGKDPEFGREKEWLISIETPPYYATELCEPIINTQGGPKHNGKAQVLDQNDDPIPRLYAAGELGSFFYPLYQSASNIAEALVFGHIAGEHAAALKAWE